MKFFKKMFPGFFICLAIFIFYFPFFTQKQLPIPGDIITGVYFPWLDLNFNQYPAGVPVKNALPSDVVSLTYPLRLLSISLIKDHQWPLWNPYILSGTPLLANFQSAALYPLNIIFLFFNNFSLAWSFQVILQFLLAYIFMYLFLRTHNISRLSCVFASFIWSFSGFFSIWGQYNTVIHSIIYLPLSLYAVKKIKQNPSFGILLTISIVFSIYSGNPPISLILIALTGFYALFEYQKNIKFYIYFIIFGLFSLLLTLPLILPGNELLNNSIRSVDKVAIEANIKFLPIYKYISLIAPDFFGNPSTLNTWSNVPLYDNSTIYAGIIPLILFLFSFTLKNKSKSLKFFLITAIVTIFLITKNPLSNLIFNLPFFGLSAMVATRLSVLLNFCIAFSSAISIDYMFKSKSLKNLNKSTLIVFAFLLIAILSVTFVYLWLNYFPNLFPNHIISDFSVKSRIIKEFNVSIRNSVLPLFLIFSTFFIFTFKNKLPKTLLIILIFSITFFDLFRFFKKYNSFTSYEFLYPENEITNYLQNNSTRFARENAEIMPSNMWMPYGLYSSSGFDTLHSLKYNQFLSLVNGSSLESTTSRFAEINQYKSPLLNFLGISHFITVKRKEGKPDQNGDISYLFDTKKYPIVFQKDNTAILQNKSALPIIYPVSDYKISTNIEETEKLLLSFDLSKTVILNSTNEYPQISQKLPQLNNIKISTQETNLDITSEETSLLVTSQNYDSGWRLYIDGKISSIIQANHSFMAFFAPKGSHHIKLVYQPSQFFIGLKIAYLSAIILILFESVLLYKSKKIKQIT